MYQTTQLNPIDRLFLRMASFYGKHWLDMWADVPVDSVKAEWQAKLSGMSSKTVFKAVDYCADNLRFPPTLPEFVQLCKANTPHEINKAIGRQFTQEELQKNHERITEISNGISTKSKTDFRAWIKPIIANPKAYPDISLKLAKEVEAMQGGTA